MLFLRLALGAIFIAHGQSKLFVMGPQTVADRIMEPLGIPNPYLAAWVVSIVEFGGGIALIMGLFTHIASLLIAIDMAVVIVFAKFAHALVLVGPGGAELEISLFVGLLTLLLLGGGKLSLARFLRRWA